VVKIVTDSLSDITPEQAKELGITVVPLNVHFGDELFKDRIDMSTDDFYQKLVTSNVHPTTSAPAPGIFVEIYNKLADETDEIVVLMTSDKLSAVGESALQAKAMVEKKCNIEVINTKQIVGAEAVLVYLALEEIKKGSNLEQITKTINAAIPRVHARMVFDTLEFLRKGGRIGKAQALVGGLLKIHPILGLKDGEIVPFSRARNRKQAVDFVVDFVKSYPKIDSLIIEHATTPDELDALYERLCEIVPKEKIRKSRVSAVIGTHTGTHVLAICLLAGE
jgi:DegV family protein with EDD domain